ncbi:hypothetical protein MNV49_001762 [Pseudohyphozyma bogoriensis]|nr:hypothetical protein MNV49_001762 [Pseudohyphozyma bogoriensis]
MTTLMVHHLPPTKLIPNSPFPLLHYRNAFAHLGPNATPQTISNAVKANNWDTHWLVRYGDNQRAHYHSIAHESMVVLTGSAKILFGAGDLDEEGEVQEEGGVVLEASVGDVFVIPAGVSHKTHAAKPAFPFTLLTPGPAEGVYEGPLDEIELTGFTMMGFYEKGAVWNMAYAGDGMEKPVPKALMDPVRGSAEDGLVGIW